MSGIYSPEGKQVQSRGGFHSWLERYRIFFETVAAVLLSAMAILVSVFQGCVAHKQTMLMETQTRVSVEQLENQKRERMIRDIGELGALELMCVDLNFLYPDAGIDGFNKISRQEWKEWFQKALSSLRSQTKNEVLNSDPVASRCYNLMLSSAEMGVWGLLGRTTPINGVEQMEGRFLAEIIHTNASQLYQRLSAIRKIDNREWP